MVASTTVLSGNLSQGKSGTSRGTVAPARLPCSRADLASTAWNGRTPFNGRLAKPLRARIGGRPFASTEYNNTPSLSPLRRTSTDDSSSRVESVDFLVLGSGIAGLSYALAVAEHGRVAVVTKGAADDGCTRLAQGGICAVLDPLDSVEAHVRDTMRAGAWLNDPRAVDIVCREGPNLVLGLARMGAEFTMATAASKEASYYGSATSSSPYSAAQLHLTREGGHSARRIVHAADATGAEIERALLARALAHPNISIHEHHLGIDLVTGDVGGERCCLGADVLDSTARRRVRFLAPVTLLATGGAGQLYPVTTNPAVATGDGMAMAARAGARLHNLEFVQFHPTALKTASINSNGGSSSDDSEVSGRTFLISEAVRGEGGRLYNERGERFMSRYDAERMELAPRDVVARAIQAEMEATGQNHVLLDISHLPRTEVLSHFPTIAARCAARGLDMAADPLPVAPAQHYMCGGVATGLEAETSIPGLLAAGEVAHSGLHGANRLASNSLLEGLVFAHRAVPRSVRRAEHVNRRGQATLCALRREVEIVDGFGSRGKKTSAPTNKTTTLSCSSLRAQRKALQELMWRGAGIVRSERGMQEGLERVEELRANADLAALSSSLDTDGAREALELRNLSAVGAGVLRGALARRESRGGHYRVDFSETVVPEREQRLLLDLARGERVVYNSTTEAAGASRGRDKSPRRSGLGASAPRKRSSSPRRLPLLVPAAVPDAGSDGSIKSQGGAA